MPAILYVNINLFIHHISVKSRDELRAFFSVLDPFLDTIVWYGRYIDDLILIWGRDVASIPHLVQYVKNNTLGQGFTSGYSKDKVNFLDLTLEGDFCNNKINTYIFRKPGSGNTILNARSNHPQHTTKAIPTGEYIRLKRACSNPDAFDSQTQSLNDRLKKRSYKKWHLDRAQARTKDRTRESLLKGNQKFDKNTNNTSNIPTFSIAYSTDFDNIKKMINRYIPILNKKYFGKGCRCVSKKGNPLQTYYLQVNFLHRLHVKHGFPSRVFIPVVEGYAIYANMSSKRKIFVTQISQRFIKYSRL